MKKICLSILVSLSTSTAFAATTTPAFDTFMNNVSNDVQSVNASQSAQNNTYKEANRQLVYTAKGNGSVKGVNAFLSSYQDLAFPHLVSANKAITNLSTNASASDINAAISQAKSEINQYQNNRMALFNNPATNVGGYYVVNREANLYLCTYENSQIEKVGKSKLLKLVVNTAKVASCELNHEKNPSLDLDKKATVYSASITAPASVANIALANAEYFSSNQFAVRVNDLVSQQKADAKKVIDANINAAACKAKVEDFRDSFNTAAQKNANLKSILNISQPKSLPRDYIDVLGLDKNNLVKDALDLSYVALTGKAIKDANKDYDICDYKAYLANKSNNIYTNKLINFDDIAKKTNGALTPEQAYQLFVMSSAKTTSYIVADKNSGSGALFNK